MVAPIIWVAAIAAGSIVTYLLGKQVIEQQMVDVGGVKIPVWMVFVLIVVVIIVIALIASRRGAATSEVVRIV